MSDRMILLVEDNADDEKLTLRALSRNNWHNVVTAHDGEEALDYLNSTGVFSLRVGTALPTVVLLDLKIPKLDGLEVLKRLRADERTKRLPVVVLTSSKEEQDLAASYSQGANSYIRKPVDFNEFMEAVKQLGIYWLVLNEPPPL